VKQSLKQDYFSIYQHPGNSKVSDAGPRNNRAKVGAELGALMDLGDVNVISGKPLSPDFTLARFHGRGVSGGCCQVLR